MLLYVILDCSGSLSRLNSHQMNLTNFYHNAPTRDIRLFMKSFSNEQSPNGRNLRNLTNFYHNASTGDIRLFMQSFSNEQSPNEPYEFLPQCSYT
ncbi:hypothetical protein OROHE_020979 [Orobanche hederae]